MKEASDKCRDYTSFMIFGRHGTSAILAEWMANGFEIHAELQLHRTPDEVENGIQKKKKIEIKWKKKKKNVLCLWMLVDGEKSLIFALSAFMSGVPGHPLIREWAKKISIKLDLKIPVESIFVQILKRMIDVFFEKSNDANIVTPYGSSILIPRLKTAGSPDRIHFPLESRHNSLTADQNFEDSGLYL